MSLKRRSANRFSANIWPGFVDAMTALLLVLMFVLTIFMVVQFVLRETITGKDEELDSLSTEIGSLAQALGLAQDRGDQLQGNVDLLNATLADEQDRTAEQAASITALNRQSTEQKAQIATLNGQADKQAAEIAVFEQQVASLLARNSDLSASLSESQARIVVLTETENTLNAEAVEAQDRQAALEDENRALLADKGALERANLAVISEREALQLALVQARDEIDESTEAARLAAAKREALEVLIADLQSDVSQKQGSLADALALLARTQGDLDGTRSSLSDALAGVSTSNAELARTRGELGNTRAELGSTRSELNNARAELGSIRTTLEATQGNLAEQEGLSAVTQEELARVQAELQEQAGQNRAARQELSQTQTDLAQAQQELTQRGLSEEQLRQRIEELVNGLSDEEKAKLAEAAAAAALREKLKGAEDELTAMTLSLESERKKAEETLTLLAAAEAVARGANLEAAENLSAAQKQAALMAAAQNALREQQAISRDGARKVALLNRQTGQLREQLDTLQGLLDAANAADAASKIQIESLGANLNTALARVAAEQRKLAEETQKRVELETAERKRLEAEAVDLKKFRSEFFGRLRDVLGSREGVRIVGDRFVFSSEILFGAGSAELGFQGQEEIAKVAGIILDVADQIPSEIDWILRVDGHTDKEPLSGRGQYKDNWELSQARALSVVKYLISDLGVPAGRLAANGFGEFQPIAYGDDEDTLALNRRIELKFTEK